MEDLNATQLILLALLVSFVTSIATGIVTITLMDQAPPAVTQTISRVVEKTVEVVAPPKTQPSVTQTVVVKEEDFIVDAAQKNAANVVTIGQLKKRFTLGIIGTAANKDDFQMTPTGAGFAVTKDGLIIAQDIPVGIEEQLIIRNPAGISFKAQVVMRDEKNGIALLQAGEPVLFGGESESLAAKGWGFADASFADSDTVRLGQTAIALGSDNGLLLLIGVLSRVDSIPHEGGEETVTAIFTTIEGGVHYYGGPLLDTNARVIGVNNVTKDGVRFTVPSNSIKALVDAYKKSISASAAVAESID